MNDRMKSHGRAAWATLGWLHGRRPKEVSMFSEPTRFGVPDPQQREHVEEACRLLLSVPLGEQLVAGGTAAEHITAERREVRRALEVAGRLGPGHPVDNLERIYDDLHATLVSPKIWHCTTRLAETLVKERLLSGERCASVLKAAMVDRRAAKFGPAPATRRITVVDGER
jgi:hypothetical protein